MAKQLSLAGRVFGRWTVVKQVPRPASRRQAGSFWMVRCTCGNTEIRSGGHLNAGRGNSGCLMCRSHGATIGKMTPEYQSWRGMRERCLNPKHASYANYGGRGIRVCAEWLHSFAAFRSDMGVRPRGHSLDRINSDGPYNRSNCRWADARTQARNSRNFALSDEQVSAVRELLDGGAAQRVIATAIGVSRSHIANIATGHSRMEAA